MKAYPIDSESNIHIAIIFSESPYEREAIKRVNHGDIEGVKVFDGSMEDLIVHK